MKTDNANDYPYLQVIIMFAGLGSIVGGLIAELAVLWVFRDANIAQISYQPLLYVGLLGFIPALLTAMVVAYKQIRHSDIKSICTIFLVGFMMSAFYISLIILYLGINSVAEIGMLFIFMIVVGVFGGINSAIASIIALPKLCEMRFDKDLKKEDDIYKALPQIK